MKRFLASLLFLFCAILHTYAQDTITLPLTANVVADIGNGPIKVRVISGNTSIFTAQGSGVGSTSGVSTSLTLTAVPATAPKVGAIISGTGITSGTTVSAYNGVTSITLSAPMSVASGTAVAWGASCPASAAGIPAHYIPASVSADYFLLYTQARVCAVAPGGPQNTLLILPIFYDQTSPAGGGGSGGAVSSVFGRTGAVVAQAGDYNFNQLAGTVGCAQLPSFTGDVTNVACALTIGAAKVTAAMLQAGAAASNVGALGGVLSGTLPNPGWANANANTVLSNWTGGSAAPVFNTWPACANDGSHALVYINGTGLQCATITAGSGTVTSVTITGSTGLVVSGTCNSTSSISCNVAGDKATAANLEAGASNKLLTSDNIYDAEVSITFATALTFDFNTFLNARTTLTNNVSTLTCSNAKASQSGVITLVQDGTGSRTMVSSWCSIFRWANGTRPILSTPLNSVDALFYQCISSSICYVSLGKAQAN